MQQTATALPTLSPDGRLYVIDTGHGVTTLSVASCRTWVTHLSRLANRQMPSLSPEDLDGLYLQYVALRQHWCDTPSLNARTLFHPQTPVDLCRRLERAREQNARVRIVLGDAATGRAWLEEHDLIGRIGRSCGPMRVPLLLEEGESGGPALLDHCIVKLIDLDRHKTLYCHGSFHVPDLHIRSIGADEEGLARQGYTHCVEQLSDEGTLTTVARFRSHPDACHWVAFVAGVCHEPPR
jgi:hypothetical protein